MSEELIDSYIDRKSIKDDTDFMTTQLKAVYNQFLRIKSVKLDLNGDKTFKQVADSVRKLKTEEDELIKISNQVEDTYRKRMALESEQAKLLAEEKELMRLRNAELKNQVREDKAAAGSIEQLRAQLIRLNKEYDNLSKEERNSAIGKDLQKNILSVNAELSKLEQGTGRFQRNVGNYSGAVKVLEKALQDVKQKLDDFTNSGNTNAEVLQRLQQEEELLEKIVNSSANGFVSMRQEIKENQIAIEQLSKIYGEDSEIVRQLIHENGKLRDSFGDLKATQKAVGSDTFVFDGLLQSAQALAGIYGAVTGAAALYGDENEDLQKSMQKLIAVMAIVQGVQAAVNALQKEGAAIQLFYAAQSKIAATAQSILTFAMAGTTAAARALRIALISTGLGAIIFLLSSFTAATVDATDSTNDQADSQKKLNDQLKEFRTRLQEAIDQSEKLRNAKETGLNQLKREAALLDASGNKQGAYLKNQAALQEEINNLKTKAASIAREDYATQVEYAVAITEINEQIKDKQNEIAVNTLDNNKRIADDAKKTADKLKDIQQQLTKFNDENKRKEFEAYFKVSGYTLQEALKVNEAITDDEERSLQDRLDALDAAATLRSQIITGEKNFAIKSLEDQAIADKESILKRKLTDKERINLLKGLTNQRLLIETDGESKLLDSTKATGKKRNELIKANLEKTAKDEAEAFQKRIAQEQLQTANQAQITATAYSDEIIALNDQLQRKALSVEDYGRQRAEIELKYSNQAIENGIAEAQRLIELYKVGTTERANAEQKLADLRKQLSDANLAVAKEETDKLKQLYTDLYSSLSSLITDLVTGSFEAQKNAIQDQIDAAEAKKQKDIDVANQTIVNEQDKAAAIAVINAKADAEKSQSQLKQRQLDQQAARFERDFKGFQIATTTVESIAKIKANIAVLLSNPLTAAYAAIAAAQIPITIAIGAAQLAALFAKPIPKYAMGKRDNYEGLAVVGDGGRQEVIEREDGTVEVTPAHDALTYVNSGDRIYSSIDKWRDHAFNAAMNKTINYDYSLVNNKGYMDTKNLEREMKLTRAAIANKKELHLNSNKGDIRAVVKRAQDTLSWINQQTQF